MAKFKNHLKDGLEAVSFRNELCCFDHSFTLHLSLLSLLGGGGGTSRPFNADLKGNLIDDLLRKEKRRRSVFFHLSSLWGKYRGLCKPSSHIVAVVNEWQTDFCT